MTSANEALEKCLKNEWKLFISCIIRCIFIIGYIGFIKLRICSHLVSFNILILFFKQFYLLLEKCHIGFSIKIIRKKIEKGCK